MTPTLRLFLLGIVGAMIAVTGIWQAMAHFNLDAWGFFTVVALMPVPVVGGLYYTYVRRDDRIAAMLLAYAFLLAFAPCCSILTYFALDSAGPQRDNVMAAIDRAMGFNWPQIMVWASNHPAFNKVLQIVYILSVWQITPLIALLGWNGSPSDIGKLCLAISLCTIVTIFTWAMYPSFGAIAYYGLPPSVASKLTLALDLNYTHRFQEMLRHGPGLITPMAVKGVIGFPSFHAQEAVVATWYARKYRYLFPAALVFNLLAIIAIPIQGGHHVIDAIVGIVIAVLMIAFAERVADAAEAHDARTKNIVLSAA